MICSTQRVVVNVALLVFMAAFATSLKADVPERTIAALTVFMAIVSWVFILVDSSPKMGYITRLDQ